MPNTTVKDVMNPKVVVAKPQATIKEAAEIMSQLRIGCLLVMEDEKVIGIVTESDIIGKIVAKKRDPERVTVDEIMTKNIISTTPDETLDEAAEKMVENKIKRLPVLDGGKLVGIITATDLISFEPKMIETLSELFSMKSQIGRTIAG
ncbi:MAG: CBS domain-containing protein [Candidatus Aenigmarchaeota archaeon]|nr:CBS domain-containing protein [Candidatus Aenigmarchaeota archaeon]MBU5688694.1 CBS domain-containing protein [Candidatus Aenigmarchaeota archaeon]